MSSDPIINELSQLVALQAQAAVHNLRYGAAPGYANLAPDEALLGGQRVKKTRIADAMGVGAPLPATSYSIHVQKGDNTSKIARREGVSVAALIAANPTKETVIVGGKRVFARLRAGEFLRTPRAARISVGLGAPSMKPFKQGAPTQTCGPCPPYMPWTDWAQKNAEMSAPAGMKAQAVKYTDSCGCTGWDVYYYSSIYPYGQPQSPPVPPPGTSVYVLQGARAWSYVCLTPQGVKMATAKGWTIHKVMKSMGVGDPLIDLSTDLEAECTNAGGTWNGSECVGPELQTGLDNINIPTGGSGGGAPRTGGATRPSGGTKTSATTTSMPKPESPSKTMAVLKALGIVAAGAAVVGGGVYLYKTKKKKKR